MALWRGQGGKKDSGSGDGDSGGGNGVATGTIGGGDGVGMGIKLWGWGQNIFIVLISELTIDTAQLIEAACRCPMLCIGFVCYISVCKFVEMLDSDLDFYEFGACFIHCYS